MEKSLFAFLELKPLKQFVVTFIVLTIAVLVITGAQTIEPSFKAIALNFLPMVVLSAVFVLFLRIYFLLARR